MNSGMIAKVLTGTGLLICLYLIVANASGTASIINSAAGMYTNSIKTLQGRG